MKIIYILHNTVALELEMYATEGVVFSLLFPIYSYILALQLARTPF